MKIYTKMGDAGESSLYDGTRLPKNDARFAALGDVDELNSALGVCGAWMRAEAAVADGALAEQLGELAEQLVWIQSRLLDVGSAVATPVSGSRGSEHLKRASEFGSTHAETLESWIDAHESRLPRLTNFILPGGGCVSASLHHARAVCRRAERSVTPFARGGECDPDAAVFLNRLSDYLFVAARSVAGTQIVYKKGGVQRT